MVSKIIKTTAISLISVIVVFLLYLAYLAFFAPKLKIVRVREGLGNQLYMYALAYALQQEIKITEPNAKVVLDLWQLKKNDKRSWVRNYFDDYNNFNIIFNEHKVNPITRFARKLVSKRINAGDVKNNEKGNLNVNIYGQDIDVFYKSAVYFDKYRKDIIKMLKDVKGGLDEKNLQIIKQMRSYKNSVAVNVRLGDYLDNKNKHKLYLCSPDYYNKAIKEFEKLLPDAHFFVFSDDIKTAEKLLHFTKPHTIVDVNPLPQAQLNLVLSSSAHHNLVSNSTFAWWAAYMNEHKDKIIIAPRYWGRSHKDELLDAKEGQYLPRDFNVIYIDNLK